MSISPVIYLTSLEGLGIDGCSKEGEYFIGVCFCFVLFKEGHRNNNDFGTYHLLALSYLGRGKKVTTYLRYLLKIQGLVQCLLEGLL